MDRPARVLVQATVPPGRSAIRTASPIGPEVGDPRGSDDVIVAAAAAAAATIRHQHRRVGGGGGGGVVLDPQPPFPLLHLLDPAGLQ